MNAVTFRCLFVPFITRHFISWTTASRIALVRCGISVAHLLHMSGVWTSWWRSSVDKLINWIIRVPCIFVVCLFVCFWRESRQWTRASSFTRFLDHPQRRTTVGMTPLDEWSARRRDLYLTTHNTHNRQTSMPLVGFEPTISAGERPQTYALDRAATGIGFVTCSNFSYPHKW